MEAEMKVAVFEKYDFSRSGLIRRAGMEVKDSRTDLYHDIAGIVQTMLTGLSALAEGEGKDINRHQKLQDSMYKGYGWLQCRYRGIDWHELDSGDPDFQVFFKMKTSIDDLGRSLDHFLEKARREAGRKMDSAGFRDTEKQLQDMGDVLREFMETKERLAAS